MLLFHAHTFWSSGNITLFTLNSTEHERTGHTFKMPTTFFVTVFLAITITGRVGLWFCGFYVQEHLKAQPAVVLVLKRFRRWGHDLKSQPFL